MSAKPTPPLAASAARDESLSHEVDGTIIRQLMTQSITSGNGYWFNNLAIIIINPDSGEEMVITAQLICSYGDTALCRKGDKIKFKIGRATPQDPWTMSNYPKIVFDLAQARADAGRYS